MVTVKIKESSKQAKALIEMLKTLSYVEVVEPCRYNATTEKAIKDATTGKTSKVNLKEFRKQLYA